MKKFLTIAVIISTGALFTFSSCGKKMGGLIKGESYVTSGWVDNNTFRIVAGGVATRTITSKYGRKLSSKRAAILNAQYQIIEKFKGSKIEGAAGMQNFEMTGIAIAQQLKAITKGGKVVKETYDAEENCEIVYQVYGKNLKAKAGAAEWK